MRARVLESLDDRDRETRAYYIDTTVHRSGDEFVVGGHAVTRPADTVVVFVDDEPGMNWAHACRYLLFEASGGSFEVVEARMPPSLTDVPGTYRPLSLPPGVPPWALWYSE